MYIPPEHLHVLYKIQCLEIYVGMNRFPQWPNADNAELDNLPSSIIWKNILDNLYTPNVEIKQLGGEQKTVEEKFEQKKTETNAKIKAALDTDVEPAVSAKVSKKGKHSKTFHISESDEDKSVPKTSTEMRNTPASCSKSSRAEPPGVKYALQNVLPPFAPAPDLPSSLMWQKILDNIYTSNVQMKPIGDEQEKAVHKRMRPACESDDSDGEQPGKKSKLMQVSEEEVDEEESGGRTTTTTSSSNSSRSGHTTDGITAIEACDVPTRNSRRSSRKKVVKKPQNEDILKSMQSCTSSEESDDESDDSTYQPQWKSKQHKGRKHVHRKRGRKNIIYSSSEVPGANSSEDGPSSSTIGAGVSQQYKTKPRLKQRQAYSSQSSSSSSEEL